MRIVTEVVHDEIYTFTPNDGNEPISIMSGRLRKWLLANAMDKVIELTFPEETFESVVERHGIEMDRLNSMNIFEANEPVIVGLYPSGTHILIDGAHRRAYWHRKGVNILKGWAVPEEVWRCYQFDPQVDTPYALHLPDGSMLPQRRQR